MAERQSIEYRVPLPRELGETISATELKMAVGDKPKAVSLVWSWTCPVRLSC